MLKISFVQPPGDMVESVRISVWLRPCLPVLGGEAVSVSPEVPQPQSVSTSGQSDDHSTTAGVDSSPMASQSPSLPPSSSSPTVTTNIYSPPTSEPASTEPVSSSDQNESSEKIEEVSDSIEEDNGDADDEDSTPLKSFSLAPLTLSLPPRCLASLWTKSFSVSSNRRPMSTAIPAPIPISGYCDSLAHLDVA
nr:hypothetical protein Iba_chr10bCG12890 [Ipomoea batatas]